jgi:hypothetical protein
MFISPHFIVQQPPYYTAKWAARTLVFPLNGNTFEQKSSTNFRQVGTTSWMSGPFAGQSALGAVGTGNYLTNGVRSTGSFGTGIFAIEFFYYNSSATTNAKIIMGNTYNVAGGWALYSNGTALVMVTGGGSDMTGTGITSATNQWKFVQVIRDGAGRVSMRIGNAGSGGDTTTTEFYASTGNTTNYNSIRPMNIGNDAGFAGSFSGIDRVCNVRITKGIIPSFTIPTSANAWPIKAADV